MTPPGSPPGMEVRTFSAEIFEADTGDIDETEHAPIEFFIEPKNNVDISDIQITIDDLILIEPDPREITVEDQASREKYSLPLFQYDPLYYKETATKTYFATIEVDDLDAAVAFINALEGVALPPDSNAFESKLDPQQGEIGRAVKRTVPLELYDFTVEQLQQYGVMQLQSESGEVINSQPELTILFMKRTE